MNIAAVFLGQRFEVEFKYLNHAGEKHTYKVAVASIQMGTTNHYKEIQPLLNGHVFEEDGEHADKVRTFAITKIEEWKVLENENN